MKDVQDRIVQYANRYKLTNVETGEVLGTFDFDEVSGTVQQVGTEIDAELFDSIANDLAKRVRVDAKQNFSAGQKQQAKANIDAAGTSGTYVNLIAGGVNAVSIPSTDDLNNYFGVNYWGKIFYWMGGANPVNVPSRINGGSLVVLRFGGSSTIQILSTGVASVSSARPTIYQRQMADISIGWSEWEEIVTADGTYPTLGAGYLVDSNVSSRQSTVLGWHKVLEIAANKVGNTDSSAYSGLLLINGIRGSADESQLPIAGSSIVEIDTRLRNASAFFTNRLVINVLNGYLDNNSICGSFNSDGSVLSIYLNLSAQFMQYNIAKLFESAENVKAHVSAITFTDEFYGTTAPEGAVYAVVRNIASYAESIPVASESVFGGAKMWVDGGKLYIKTE